MSPDTESLWGSIIIQFYIMKEEPQEILAEIKKVIEQREINCGEDIFQKDSVVEDCQSIVLEICQILYQNKDF